MKKVGFRVDGNAKIGMGHVMRTLALAGAFPADLELIFIVKEEAAVVKKLREFRQELKIITLPAECSTGEELNRLHSIIKKEGIDILIIDSYSFDQDFLVELKNIAGRLVSIHDFAPFPFPSDIVINGNIYAPELAYESLEGNTRFLLGTEYLLLREEFSHLPERRLNEKARRILVTVGGGDPLNLTPKIIKAVDNIDNYCYKNFTNKDEFKEELELDVIIGPAFDNVDEIVAVVKEVKLAVRLHFNVQRISQLMLDADLAVSAGGSTLYEMAVTGTPAIAILQADNQIQAAETLAEKGTIINLGMGDGLETEDITESLIELINNNSLRKKMSERGQKLVDGKGAERCVKEIISLL